MSSKIKLKNANGNTLEVKNNDAVLEDLNVSYFNTVEELTTAVGSDGDLAIVADLDRGGNFKYDSTATDNGGTVFGKWVRQYDGAINVKWFGTKGDGVADDTIAIQNALSIGGKIIGKGSYKTTSTLVLSSNTQLDNINILSTAPKVFVATGSEDGYVSLSSDSTYKSFSCTVSDASSFKVDDWAFIKSNGYWSISDDVKMGEYVKIQSISSNTLYFYDAIVGDYLVSDSASISPVTLKENIEFNNCTINGDVSIDNQYSMEFTLCKDIRINNTKTKDFDHTHINFIRCINYEVNGGEASKTGVQEGLDYGVAHTRGCYNGKVIGFTGNAMRHISTIGGSEGISRFINVSNCFGYSLTDGGIDAHSAVYEHNFSNNFLSFDDTSDTTVEGVISNGGRPTIENNTIINCRRHGVLWQPMVEETTATIIGNIGNNNATGNKLSSTNIGINVSGNTCTVNGVNISNNTANGFDYFVGIDSGDYPINNVVINAMNTSESTALRGIVLDASANDIVNVNINGNIIENVSNENVYIIGSATSAVKDINMVGNNIKGGTYAVRGTYVQGGKIEANYITGYSSAKMLFDANSNIAIDKGITKTQTGSSTYTLLTHETDFIYNRAATLTLTLPDPTVNEDKEFRLKTIQAQAINSASSNVVPIDSVTAGTAILPATAGSWCTLKSDGTNWVIYQQG